MTFDYRCPFARNAHEHVLSALEGGAPFSVSFVPFSLSQMHVEDGQPSVFDDPSKRQDLLAMEAALVVRDRLFDDFFKVHRALFALRHDDAGDLRDEAAISSVLEAQGVDPGFVFKEIEAGWPLEQFRREHEEAESEHSVFGVPTFIVGSQAVFVRLMNRPADDTALARRMIEQVLATIAGFPELNELKHTSIPR
ncbi:MAG: DsbA family protein [Acidimicrobiales bacterium]